MNVRKLLCLSLLVSLSTPLVVWCETPKPSQRESERRQVATVLGEPVYLRVDPAESMRILHSQAFRECYLPLKKEYSIHYPEMNLTEEEWLSVTLKLGPVKLAKEELESDWLPIRRRLLAIDVLLAWPKLEQETRASLGREKEKLERQYDRFGFLMSDEFASNAKFQRAIYERFGGGRVLNGKFGVVGSDALIKWFQGEEAAGRLKFSDDEFREAFYEFWITEAGTSFLHTDPEECEKVLRFSREEGRADWSP